MADPIIRSLRAAPAPRTLHTDISDPAPDAAVGATSRVANIVREVNIHAIAQLRELRDEIDDMIRQSQENEATIVAAIERHGQLAIEIVKVKGVVVDTMQQLRASLSQVTAADAGTQHTGSTHSDMR